MALGYFTPGMPVLTAAQLTGSEQLPLDTEYAGGVAPQSAAITPAQLALYVSGGTGGVADSATATAGAATSNSSKTKITSEALTTAAAAAYTLTLTNSVVTAASVVLVSVANGTNTQGIPVVSTVVPAAGSVVIKVFNLHASQALNGTLVISVRVI